MKRQRRRIMPDGSVWWPPGKMRGSSEPIPGRCGKKLRRSKEKWGVWRYCKGYPVKGRDQCRMHGGRQPQGIASVHYKGRGYSRHINKGMQDIYAAQKNDPKLMSLREDIALSRTRVMDLLSRADEFRPDEIVNENQGVFRRARVALDQGRLNGEMDDLQEAIAGFDRLKSAEQVWANLGTWLDRVNKLVNTERRLAYEEKRAITSDQMLTIQALLLNWIRQLILDHDGKTVVARDMLMEAQESFGRLFGFNQSHQEVLETTAQEVRQ